MTKNSLFGKQPQQQLIVHHGNITLWTESFGDPHNPAVLLIAGAGAPAKFWTDRFCTMLAYETKKR